jgi:hypothetical protein
MVFVHYAKDVLSEYLVDRFSTGARDGRMIKGFADIFRNIVRTEFSILILGDHGVHAVPEFPKIARPPVRAESLYDPGRDANNMLLCGFGGFLEKLFQKEVKVFHSAAKRREIDLDTGQPIIEILAKRPLRHHGLQIPMGRRDHPDLRSDAGAGAKPLDLPGLDDAKQLHLYGKREIAHLIEEERPPFRRLEGPDPPFRGAGERTLLMPEEFAFQDGHRQRRAVDDYEGSPMPFRTFVHRSGGKVLSRPGFPLEKYIGRRGGGLSNLPEDLAHERTAHFEAQTCLGMAFADRGRVLRTVAQGWIFGLSPAVRPMRSRLLFQVPPPTDVSDPRDTKRHMGTAARVGRWAEMRWNSKV